MLPALLDNSPLHFLLISVRNITMFTLLLAALIACAEAAVQLDTSTEMYLYAWPLIMSSLTKESMFYLPDNIMLPMPVYVSCCWYALLFSLMLMLLNISHARWHCDGFN